MKGKVGQRAEILFDNMDLKILQILSYPEKDDNSKLGEKMYGVLDIAEKLRIKHQNLKPHIDKLIKLGLIFVRNDNGKVVLFTHLRFIESLERLKGEEYNYRKQALFDNEREYQEGLKKGEKQKALVEFLESAEAYQREKNSDKVLDTDLRKIKEIKKLNNRATKSKEKDTP